MTRGINHLVLAADDLDRQRDFYQALGFTLAPRGQHPFGTGNTVIQLRGNYLELLAVTRPELVIEHGEHAFSFSAFNRDYLARHEGFSMLVLDSANAADDIVRWRMAGLPTYAPVLFSRPARMVDGTDTTVGFSLAFTSNQDAPWLGHFACQHYNPDYYAQEAYQRHDNTATTVLDVWISGEGALDLAEHFAAFTGVDAERDHGTVTFRTRSGDVVLATPQEFERSFGMLPPQLADGPHLASLTIGCNGFVRADGFEFVRVGDRHVLEREAFGTVLAFADI